MKKILVKLLKAIASITAAAALLGITTIPAIAAATTGMAWELSNTQANASPKYTFWFTTATEIPVAGTIVITFPSGFNISTIVNANVTETLTAGSASWVVSSQTLTGTIAGSAVTTGAQKVVIGDGITGGLNDITNHNTPATYSVTLSTSAGDSGSWSVIITSGFSAVSSRAATLSVKTYIEFTITDYGTTGINFGSLDPGTSDNPEENQPGSAAVKLEVGTGTNKAVGVYLYGSNFDDGGGHTVAITNCKYYNSSDPSPGIAMQTTQPGTSWYNVSKGAGDTHNVYYWVTVPGGQDPANYLSTFYFVCQ